MDMVIRKIILLVERYFTVIQTCSEGLPFLNKQTNKNPNRLAGMWGKRCLTGRDPSESKVKFALTVLGVR